MLQFVARDFIPSPLDVSIAVYTRQGPTNPNLPTHSPPSVQPSSNLYHPTKHTISAIYPPITRFHANLQDSALDHDFHPIGRNTGELIDDILEDRCRLIRVEGDIVSFACVFDVNF